MSILASWLASPPLEAALEISPAAVSVAVLGGRSSNPVVQGYAVEPLPPGAVTPSLTLPTPTRSRAHSTPPARVWVSSRSAWPS
jgi:hypothetical protein